jgi:hypothetical protein
MRIWTSMLCLVVVATIGACTKPEPKQAPAKVEAQKSAALDEQKSSLVDVLQSSPVAPPVAEAARPQDVVSKVAPADAGRKRILPKGGSLVKLRSIQRDVQLIMPEFGNCIADLQKGGFARIPKLTLEMHVDAAGKVTSAIIVETSQSIPEFEKCILDKAQLLSLPAGEPDRVLRLPFVFGE